MLLRKPRAFQGRRHLALFVILSIFLTLKLLSLSRPSFVGWDESVYIGMGKYIYSSGQAGLFEDMRPLALPLILGIFWKLKLDLLFFGELLAILFSSAAVVLAFFLGERIRVGAGAVAAALLAFFPLFFLNSSEIMTEIPSTALAMGSLLLLLEKRFFWAGAAAGASFLFRFPQGMVFPLLAVLALLQARRWSARPLIGICAGFLAAAAPFFLFNALRYAQLGFRAPLYPLLAARGCADNITSSVLGSGISSRLAYFLYYPRELVLGEGNLLLIFSIAGLLLAVGALAKQGGDSAAVPSGPALPAVALFAAAPLLYFSWIITKQERYALQFLPFLCILAAVGILQVWRAPGFRLAAAGTPLHLGRAAVLAVLAVSLASALAYDSRDYAWRASRISEYPLVSELYLYLAENPLSPVLTTDPTPAAYADVRLIPMYYGVDSSLKIYLENVGSARAVLYSSGYYPCEAVGESCERIKEELLREVSRNTLLVHATHRGADYYLVEITP